MASSSPYERKRRRQAVRDFLDTLKNNTPCTDCKQFYDSPVMEFDHIHAKTKRNSVSRLVMNGHSLKTILTEIRKCELVCANCHRTRTTKRRKQ